MASMWQLLVVFGPKFWSMQILEEWEELLFHFSLNIWDIFGSPFMMANKWLVCFLHMNTLLAYLLSFEIPFPAACDSSLTSSHGYFSLISCYLCLSRWRKGLLDGGKYNWRDAFLPEDVQHISSLWPCGI